MLTQGRSGYGFLRRFLSVPVFLMAVFLMAAKTGQPAKVVRSPKKIVMVLDAAHGGEDAGGKGIYGDQEKDITLAISKKLVALSGEYNIEMITTRDADVYPTLEERLQTSNKTEDAIFLSVHVNKSTPGNVVGNSYELGVNPKGKNYDKSRLLASAIASKLKTQKLPVEVVDQRSAYIIRENRHPALLIECGNLDDADNMALLSDEARTEALCRNILSGIVDYNAKLGTK